VGSATPVACPVGYVCPSPGLSAPVSNMHYLEYTNAQHSGDALALTPVAAAASWLEGYLVSCQVLNACAGITSGGVGLSVVSPLVYNASASAAVFVKLSGPLCDAGTWPHSPAGGCCSSAVTVCRQCGVGRFGTAFNYTTDACAGGCSCAPGSYCMAGSMSAASCSACIAGHWCAGAAAPPVACTCAFGYFCDIGSASTAGQLCPSGYLCAGGASLSVACSAGHYCPAFASAPLNCSCSPGYACSPGSSTMTCIACIAGFYCPGGATPQSACTELLTFGPGEPINTFENGPVWTQRDNGVVPVQDCTTAADGACSVYFPSSWGRYFDNGGYPIAQYPFMCMSYKVPPTTVFNMLINLNNCGGWRSLTQHAVASCGYPQVATWAPILADGNWHKNWCINLHEQLAASCGTDDVQVVGVILYDGGCGGFYGDVSRRALRAQHDCMYRRTPN
jgi:hypothetical protein